MSFWGTQFNLQHYVTEVVYDGVTRWVEQTTGKKYPLGYITQHAKQGRRKSSVGLIVTITTNVTKHCASQRTSYVLSYLTLTSIL